MWRQKRISVILPTYNEKDSIREAIQQFVDTGVVDEVLVINNNAAEGTSEEVAKTSAIEIHEARQGYGYACQRGLREATGHYIVLSEPDGTFFGRDILKLLAYAEDFDLVLGTRTAKDFIWHGANMGPFLRWGNWAVAKQIEVLFNTTSLTDVGCTMRLITRPALGVIQDRFRVGGSHFGPEMMLLAITSGLRVVQVPVNYAPRVGVSSVTGSKVRAFLLGLQMIALVLKFRLRTSPWSSAPKPERRRVMSGRTG